MITGFREMATNLVVIFRKLALKRWPGHIPPWPHTYTHPSLELDINSFYTMRQSSESKDLIHVNWQPTAKRSPQSITISWALHPPFFNLMLKGNEPKTPYLEVAVLLFIILTVLSLHTPSFQTMVIIGHEYVLNK